MKLQIEIAGKIRTVDYQPGETIVTIDGAEMEVHAQVLRPGVLSLIVEGRAWRIVLEEHTDAPAVHVAGKRVEYRVDDPRSLKARRAQAGGSNGPMTIKASMPGRVVRVVAQPGEIIEANQGVVVIEAMKMQNEIKAPKGGRVAELRVAAGDTVSAGDVLAVIE